MVSQLVKSKLVDKLNGFDGFDGQRRNKQIVQRLVDIYYGGFSNVLNSRQGVPRYRHLVGR